VTVEIEEVRQATPEVHEALKRLLPQLNPTLPLPTAERIQRLMDDSAVTLVVARDGGRIVGTATVIVYTTPYWIKARLDEVVVDKDARGRGVGEAIVRHCLDVGRRKGAQVAELQSGRGEVRFAAHRLYKRIGFQVRDSDIFRISL
jgi:GNAT superfamily N-acetyltransferase